MAMDSVAKAASSGATTINIEQDATANVVPMGCQPLKYERETSPRVATWWPYITWLQ